MREALWLQRFLAYFKINVTKRLAKLYVDNRSAIDKALNKVKTKYKKHIDVRRHHLAHHVKQWSSMIQHIGNRQTLAEGLTKPLEATRHAYLPERIDISHSCMQSDALEHHGVWANTDTEPYFPKSLTASERTPCMSTDSTRVMYCRRESTLQRDKNLGSKERTRNNRLGSWQTKERSKKRKRKGNRLSQKP